MTNSALTFFGVRGSYPVSGKQVVEYGGNTASILVEKDNQILILDAGTGLINIGAHLKKVDHKPKKIDIFITHLHIDHIQGLPFFDPVFDPDYEINIYGSEDDHISFRETIYSLFNHPFSPISNKGIKAKLNIKELSLENRVPVVIDHETSIEYIKERSHPIYGALLYKLKIGSQQVVYATDVESPEGFQNSILDFVRGCSILIHDSQYFDHEYFNPENPRKGFGHSTVNMATNNANICSVDKLFLFHYNPDHTDQDITKMGYEAKTQFKNTFLASETKKVIIRR